jgi:hypothetical protein
MPQDQILKAVSERDIDLLLLEELAVNPEFLSWWIKTTGAELKNIQPVQTSHSVTHPRLGESDLVITFETGEEQVRALLIENKMTAPPQPDQGLRYRQRGEEGIKEGHWVEFHTCLIAPERYVNSVEDVKEYDVRITYEQVRDWLNNHSNSRSAFRAQVVDQAITQSRRGYTPEVDERVTAFWKAYWDYSSKEFPELEMAEPGPKPANSTWISLKPESFPKGQLIKHKLQEGKMDLQIDGAADQRDEIEEQLTALLGTDIQVVATGKSASVRIMVPSLDPFSNFRSQLEDVQQCLKAAYWLLLLSRAISQIK